MNNLGSTYCRGHGVERDLVKARFWFVKAAESGCIEAMMNAGNVLSEGIGGAVDMEGASRWYHEAVDNGLYECKALLDELKASGSLGMKMYLCICQAEYFLHFFPVLLTPSFYFPHFSPNRSLNTSWFIKY